MSTLALTEAAIAKPLVFESSSCKAKATAEGGAVSTAAVDRCQGREAPSTAAPSVAQGTLTGFLGWMSKIFFSSPQPDVSADRDQGGNPLRPSSAGAGVAGPPVPPPASPSSTSHSDDARDDKDIPSQPSRSSSSSSWAFSAAQVAPPSASDLGLAPALVPVGLPRMPEPDASGVRRMQAGIPTFGRSASTSACASLRQESSVTRQLVAALFSVPCARPECNDLSWNGSRNEYCSRTCENASSTHFYNFDPRRQHAL